MCRRRGHRSGSGKFDNPAWITPVKRRSYQSPLILEIKKSVGVYAGLLQDRAERSFGHVTWVSRERRIAIIAGFYQISWLPAACRSNWNPQALSFRMTSR